MMTIEKLCTYHKGDLARMVAGDNWGTLAGLSKVELAKLVIAKNEIKLKPVASVVTPTPVSVPKPEKKSEVKKEVPVQKKNRW